MQKDEFSQIALFDPDFAQALQGMALILCRSPRQKDAHVVYLSVPVRVAWPVVGVPMPNQGLAVRVLAAEKLRNARWIVAAALFVAAHESRPYAVGQKQGLRHLEQGHGADGVGHANGTFLG